MITTHLLFFFFDGASSVEAPPVVIPDKPDGGGAGAKLYQRKKKYPRKVIIGGEVIWVRSLAEEMRLLAEYAAEQQAKLEALQETDAPAEQVRVQRIRVTKASQRVTRRNEADEWIARLRQEDEEILLLLH